MSCITINDVVVCIFCLFSLCLLLGTKKYIIDWVKECFDIVLVQF